MPLDKKIEVLNCRTGNHVPFHFFQLKHCLPESAAFIIFQNDASWRLACSVRTFFFLVFIGFSPPFGSCGLEYMTQRRGSPLGKANHPLGATGSIGVAAGKEAADGEDREMVAKNDAKERRGRELRAALEWII